MSISTSHPPLSVPNLVLLGTLLAGAVVTGVLGNWWGVAILVTATIAGALSALLARRPGASDWLRINALEYRDERDVRLARHGLAVVGAWALALAGLELVAATIIVGLTGARFDPAGPTLEFNPFALGFELLAAGQVLVLSIVWGIANTRAVRRQ